MDFLMLGMIRGQEPESLVFETEDLRIDAFVETDGAFPLGGLGVGDVPEAAICHSIAVVISG